jgi:5-methyltetrahydrofolate--homocysteine methyltransferase
MIIIGEKINSANKKVAEAIASRNGDFIKDLALRQYKAGAFYLDLNAGTVPSNEVDDLLWLIEQAHLAAPEAILCLDSANPEALAAGLEKVTGYNPSKIMVNSLSGQKKSLDGVLPLVSKFRPELIILGLDDSGIPEKASGRLEIIRQLVDLSRKAGLADESLYIDPLVMSIPTDNKAGLVTLEVIGAVRKEFPLCHLTCGHSNISFGMPLRQVVNRYFMALAIEAGLDTAITDPESREMRAAILATEALLGRDRHCRNFNSAFRAKLIGPLA